MLITPEYRALNAELHARVPAYGTGGHKWASTIREIVQRTGAKSVLDYGCGKGTLRKVRRPIRVHEYDPAIPAKANLPASAGVVVCTDVMEHVEPGSFRTDWAGRSMAHAPEQIADYEESAGAFRASLAQRNGRQAGDPRKAALAIIKAVEANEPPLHLLLGHDALNFVGAKLGALQAEIMKWAPVSAGTNFDS